MRQRKLGRAVLSVGRMSADEKRALIAALECLRDLKGPVRRMEECLADIGLAMQRTHKRRESDAATDKVRRVTVGARVRVKDAQRYRECAQYMGVSMYRFIVDALEMACVRVGQQMAKEQETIAAQGVRVSGR